jgi:hypothetical protein
MRKLIVLSVALLLGYFAIRPAPALAYDVPVPIVCMEYPTCDCVCTNDPFAGYWNGCMCGGYGASPTCVECADDYGCSTAVYYDGWAVCLYRQGICYAYGICEYTGP